MGTEETEKAALNNKGWSESSLKPELHMHWGGK